jgi:hypothetical protein
MTAHMRFAVLASAALALALATPACSSETEDDAVDVGQSEDEIVATFDRSGRIDLNKTTHVLLVGNSDKLVDLPLQAATTKARRYAYLHPDDQVVVFITEQAKASHLAKNGVTLVQNEPFARGGVAVSDLTRLSSAKLVAALRRFPRIASLDFFGHSSPFGALLEVEGDDRILDGGSPAIASLAANFARDMDPYVTLNGCNGGVSTAAALSRLWKVPVAGALTASNFETLFSDGRWYPDDNNMIPPGVTRVARNDKSFQTGNTPSCASGACIRMKPQNSPYYGVWSNQDTGFQYGLNYYKFFCDYDDPTNTCARGMAMSLYAFPSTRSIHWGSSDVEVNEVLADFFCGGNKDATWFDTCKAGLANAVATGAPFSPMKGANDYSLECTFKTCATQQTFRCDMLEGVPQKKTCAWVSPTCAPGARPDACRPKNTTKQTTRTELLKYLEGHRLLRGS